MISKISSLATSTPWGPYGLRENPYFQAELAPDPGARYPVSLFVGRDDDVQLLNMHMLGTPSSRAVVEGDAGVGKTSLVNRLKATLATRGIVSHAQPVRMEPDLAPQDVVAEVLRALLQIRASLLSEEESTRGRAGRRKARQAPADRSAPHPLDDERFWGKISRLVEGEDTLGGGFSVGGVGLSAQRGRIAPEVRTRSLYAELSAAIASLATVATGGVLIHLNNLENLTLAEARHAAEVFQTLRDYFLIPGSHWVFVGATGVDHTVFRASTQLGGVIALTVRLAPLGADEVVESLLDRRYQHLRHGASPIPPVTPDAVRLLYARYRGDLRNFLRLLSTAVERHPMAATPVSLTAEDVIRTTAALYARTLEARLGESDARHLAATLREQAVDAEIRVADVRARTKMAQSAASAFVRRLVTAGVLVPSRIEGRNAWYCPSGDAGMGLSAI